MSVRVTGTYSWSASNFRGVKDLDHTLRKRNSELSEEEIWEKILGVNFHQPHCPECYKELMMLSFHVEYYVNPIVSGNRNYAHGAWWNIRKADPTIHVEMQCASCGTQVKGIGTGLVCEAEGFYLETLIVTSVIRGALTWTFSV